MNLGFQELLLIFFVALLLFGPKKLPELARGLGRAVREFRSALREVEEGVRETLEEEDRSSHS